MPKAASTVTMSLTMQNDLLTIQKEYENSAPAEGDVIDIPVEDDDVNVRSYEFVDNKWVFQGVFRDGKKVAEPEPPKKTTKKAAKSKTTVLADELEPENVDAPKKVAKKAEQKKSEVVVEDVKEQVVTTTKAKAPPRKRAATKVDVTSSSSEDEATKPTKKSRSPVTLTDVMDALNNGDVEEAKKKLAKFMEKNGATGKVKRQRKPSVDENGNPVEKKKTPHGEFFSIELKRLSALENEKVEKGEITKEQKMKPNEMMRIVSKLWQEKKAADATK